MKCADCGGGCYRPECVPQIHGDPFRQKWLNTDMAGESQRPIGSYLDGKFVEAPKDQNEARHIEKAHGIKFLGDDASKLKPESQRAIAKYNAAKARGEVPV